MDQTINKHCIDLAHFLCNMHTLPVIYHKFCTIATLGTMNLHTIIITVSPCLDCSHSLYF